MSDSPPCFCRPNTQTDGDCTAQQNTPGDPGRLPWEFDQEEQGKERQDADGIDHGCRGGGTMGMLFEGRIARRIHSRINTPVHKGLPGGLSGLHDEGHRADTQQDSHKTRGQGTAAVKDDADQYRKTGHGNADDRDMIDGEMKMGWSEKSLHHCEG